MTGRTVRVTDRNDDRLDAYRDLTDAQLRRRVEARDRVFVVEGHLAVRSLVDSPYGIRSLLVADTRVETLGDLVSAVVERGADVLVAPLEVLVATVGFNMHRGVVALGARPADARPDEVLAQAVRAPAIGGVPVLALVEGVNDHENLGALFRNAAAFGVAGVLLDPTSADPLYRRAVRVSLGHVLRIPWARIDAWPDGLDGVTRAGFTIVGLTPAPGAPELTGVGAGPVAVLVGAEGHGLSGPALDAAAVHARIPMAPGVDSINVATAAAIAFHHFRTRPGGEGAE